MMRELNRLFLKRAVMFPHGVEAIKWPSQAARSLQSIVYSTKLPRTSPAMQIKSIKKNQAFRKLCKKSSSSFIAFHGFDTIINKSTPLYVHSHLLISSDARSLAIQIAAQLIKCRPLYPHRFSYLFISIHINLGAFDGDPAKDHRQLTIVQVSSTALHSRIRDNFTIGTSFYRVSLGGSGMEPANELELVRVATADWAVGD